MQAVDEPELVELLGSGSTFDVHRARLGPAGTRVIIKQASANANRVEAAARLNNEFFIFHDLDLPGIVAPSQWLDTAKGPVLVFPDHGLSALSKRKGKPLKPKKLEQLAIKIANLLTTLHNAGIIHRDINPSNIVASNDLKDVRLIDLCLAVKAIDIDDGAAEHSSFDTNQGTPRYSAPEQSGRMNRQTDHRSDLYSLGVTLYELATGKPPFNDDDPAALIHRHLTETPPSVRDFNPNISEYFSDAIMRLLEKNPEDRFQSAASFEAEVSNGGARKTSSTFTIPNKLYGREELLAELSADLAKGMKGPSRMIRVAGPSGNGKSALISKLVGPAVASGAHFVQGKFEQFDQSRPYGAFLQVFDMLLRRILSQSAERVQRWRTRLLDALSPNGQVLLDILPDYEKLIDSQPTVPELGLSEAQIRTSIVFRRFVGALASSEEPLFVFLDDLQWSDPASRWLIDLLLNDNQINNLTIIVAYRDNEVGASHPVTQLFANLNENQPLDPVILVEPLSADAVHDMVADCLGETKELSAHLAQIIMAKTAGNPFFIRQFLFALVRKKYVAFSAKFGRWVWDEDRAATEKISDNVADMVVERILELPQDTQDVVKLAACFGNKFSATDITLASEASTEATIKALTPAIQEQIIVLNKASATDGASNYRFLHDRIQQAAHELLPDEERSAVHALIGKLQLEKGLDEGAGIVPITDHLIAGRQHLDQDLLHKLHDLGLRAARRTKTASAQQAALYYLDVAEEALRDSVDIPPPELLFEIGLERAESAYLQDDTKLAESVADELLQGDLKPLDEVSVLELKMLLQTARLEYRDALKTGQRANALLGVKLPSDPGVPNVMRQLASTKLTLRGMTDRDLLELPPMQDEMTLAAIRVMRLMAPPAYFSSPNLLPIIAMQIVSLTAKFGRAPASGYGFVIYGMIHCAVLGNIKQGLAYGSLAREMAATPEAAEVEGSVQMMFAGFVRHWSVPLVETLPIFLTGAEKALSVGDLEFHGYNRYGHASYALMAGQSLPRISEYLEQHLAAVTEAAHEKTLGIMTMARASVNRMRGLPNDPKLSAVINKNFDIWTEQQDATSLAYHHKYQMLEHLMVGNYESALGSAKGMTANLNGILSMAYQPFYQFYEALCLIELSHSAGALKKRAMVARAQFLTRRLAKWAKHSPATLDHRVALLRAELAALSRKTSRAISGFDKAVAMARQSAALHDIGLFLERAGRFYLDQGSSEVAAIHLQSAIDAHNVWGGQTWAESITTRYPDNIRSTTIAPDASSVSSSLGSAGSLDARSLINTAVALAQKTSLEEIVVEVMQAIAMNAGATNGALILLADDTLKVVAELAPGEKVTMSKNQTLADCKHLPQSIINFVHHANERVVLDDATADETFGSDPYIKDARPFSILCAPLIFKGATVGFIYLENPGVRHAFTPERCHVVEVLAGQAAISIDNAGLFEKLNDALERQVDLTSAHARFVPHTFLEILDRPSITDVKLGDYVKGPASILFSDIRGFTALIEQLDPDEAIVFINEYLSLMEPPVLANGGFVDSYIGDAVMAVFDRGPEAAIDAGIAMARGLRSWKGGASRGMTGSIRIGIGIATGNIIFGTIGAANRLKCGVIGDTVNLASRIEGLTKFYETRMLITSETRDALPDPDRYGMREIDLVTVVGRDAPISILEIFDADSEDLREQKAKTVVPLKAGLEEFRTGNIPAALKLFKQCAKLAPDDPVSQKLIARCKNERANAKEPDWDGIQRFERK